MNLEDLKKAAQGSDAKDFKDAMTTGDRGKLITHPGKYVIGFSGMAIALREDVMAFPKVSEDKNGSINWYNSVYLKEPTRFEQAGNYLSLSSLLYAGPLLKSSANADKIPFKLSLTNKLLTTLFSNNGKKFDMSILLSNPEFIIENMVTEYTTGADGKPVVTKVPEFCGDKKFFAHVEYGKKDGKLYVTLIRDFMEGDVSVSYEIIADSERPDSSHTSDESVNVESMTSSPFDDTTSSNVIDAEYSAVNVMPQGESSAVIVDDDLPF